MRSKRRKEETEQDLKMIYKFLTETIILNWELFSRHFFFLSILVSSSSSSFFSSVFEIEEETGRKVRVCSVGEIESVNGEQRVKRKGGANDLTGNDIWERKGSWWAGKGEWRNQRKRKWETKINWKSLEKSNWTNLRKEWKVDMGEKWWRKERKEKKCLTYESAKNCLKSEISSNEIVVFILLMKKKSKKEIEILKNKLKKKTNEW